MDIMTNADWMLYGCVLAIFLGVLGLSFVVSMGWLTLTSSRPLWTEDRATDVQTPFRRDVNRRATVAYLYHHQAQPARSRREALHRRARRGDDMTIGPAALDRILRDIEAGR